MWSPVMPRGSWWWDLTASIPIRMSTEGQWPPWPIRWGDAAPVPGGGVCVTAGSTMEFLRPASGKKIFCVATPKKMGRTLSVIQVVLTNDQDVVVATGTFTFFMMD